MAQDLTITLGLDDKAFRKSLDKSGSYGSRKAFQIAKDFERAERAKARASARQTAKISKSYQRMSQVSNVAMVGMAAGIGLVGKALSKAAENNAELRNELNSLKKSSDNFLSDIGDNLAPLIGGLDSIIIRAGKARGKIVDFFAAFGSNSTNVANVNKALAEKKRRNQAFADTQKSQAITAGFGGGENADPDKDFRRKKRQEINKITDRAKRIKLREALDKELERRQAERDKPKARAQQQSNQRFREGGLGREADLAEAIASRNPKDADAARRAIDARAAAKRERASNSIENDGSLSLREKRDAQRVQRSTINQEQAKQIEQLNAAVEAEEKRERALRREGRVMKVNQKIELARAQGRDREAQAMALILEAEERKQRIMEMEGLNDEQRAARLRDEQSILDAKLGKLSRSDPGAQRSLGPGFAGDAATARQVLGTRSEGKQLLDVNKIMASTLEQIAENTSKGTVAVAG